MPEVHNNVSETENTLLPLGHNPRAMVFDSIPKRLKVFLKELSKNHSHEIIPQTANHPAWILGAQPNVRTLDKIQAKYNNTYGRTGMHVVSMLHDDEMVMGDDEFGDTCNRHRTRIPWFDHGAIDVNKGVNTSAQDMLNKQKEISTAFTGQDTQKPAVFYCHCMAGVSRSFVETVAFLYYYTQQDSGNAAKLFDFENWPKEKRDKIPVDPTDLQGILKQNPTIADIAKFVKIQRPIAKGLAKVDGDQAGLLGLIALELKAEQLRNNKLQIANLSQEQFNNLAKDLSLMLQAPLDSAFRDQEDRKKQKENFQYIFTTCENAKAGKGKELLDQMVIAASGFDRLTASQHARFAILLQNLQRSKAAPNIDWKSIISNHAEAAIQNSAQLTVGDQLEFLKAFVDKPKGSIEKIAHRIVSGTKVDRYNGGKQMAELVGYALRQQEKSAETEDQSHHSRLQSTEDISLSSIVAGVIKHAESRTMLPLKEHIEKMSAQEHLAFLEHLGQIKPDYVERYATFIKKMYDPNPPDASFLRRALSWVRSLVQSDAQKRLENKLWGWRNINNTRMSGDQLEQKKGQFDPGRTSPAPTNGARKNLIASQPRNTQDTQPDPQDPYNNEPSHHALGG